MGANVKPIPLSNQIEITNGTFCYWLDNYVADINWNHCHPELEKYATPLAEDKFLLDIFHTALDGFTITDDGVKIIEYKLDDEVKKEIKQFKSEYEWIRTTMAFRFIEQGHAQPTEFFHMMKLHLIFTKKIKPPAHLKKLMNKPIFEEKKEWISDIINQIIYDIFSKQGLTTIKNLFSPKIIKSGSGKGRRKKDPKWIPEHIEKATKSIIEKSQSINQAQLYSKKPESTFERDWLTYKYQALRQYLFDLSFNGYLDGDKRVKQITSTDSYSDLDNNTLEENTFNMEIKFTSKQHNQMQKIWHLKNLPNPIIISGLTTDKEFYK